MSTPGQSRQISSGTPKPAQTIGGGMRRRIMPSAASRTAVATKAPQQNSAGVLRYYTDDSPGLKIGPTVVLIMSLAFIVFVVLLHIWGKFTR